MKLLDKIKEVVAPKADEAPQNVSIPLKPSQEAFILEQHSVVKTANDKLAIIFGTLMSSADVEGGQALELKDHCLIVAPAKK